VVPSLGNPRITASFVVRCGDVIRQEVPVDEALEFLFVALKENEDDPAKAAAAFRAELEKLKRRA
jgi:hypothetical protein